VKARWWIGLLAIALLGTARAEDDWGELHAGALSPTWETIASGLQSHDLVRADFSEERSNRLRRRPSRFEGNLIFSTELGLSLFYDAALSSVVILDEAGVLRRAGSGERTLPVPDDEGGLHAILLDLFALDLAALETRFVIEGQGNESGWRLRLSPREGMSDALDVRAVELVGVEDRVDEIVVDRGAGMLLRIALENQTFGGELTPEIRAERFR